MKRKFIGRKSELAALQRFYTSPGKHLATVRGRRRVGKSTLLLHSLEQNKSAYHQAAQLTPDANYARFHQDMQHALKPLLPTNTASDIEHAPNWRSLLLALADASADLGRLTVVIDEFPYLSQSDPTIESVFQEALGRIETRAQPFKLVLCGSAISQMEALLSHSAPLYGRSDHDWVVHPLDYLESALFTPAWSPEQLVHARTLFGGMPRYLHQLDDTLSVGENYEQLVLDPNGPLHEETNRLLSAELHEPRVYASILMAVSRGSTKASEIINAAGIPNNSLTKYLERLEELGLVRRMRSANAKPNAKNTRYHIADSFIASWYRYALPNLSTLKVRGGEGAWQRVIAPTIDEDPHAAPSTFEDISRYWLALHMHNFWTDEHGEIGKILQGKGEEDAEIDVACRLGNGMRSGWLLGECKWQTRPQGENALRQLQTNAAKLLKGERVHHWLLVSKSGFHDEFLARPPENTRPVTLHELYATSSTTRDQPL